MHNAALYIMMMLLMILSITMMMMITVMMMIMTLMIIIIIKTRTFLLDSLALSKPGVLKSTSCDMNALRPLGYVKKKQLLVFFLL